MRNISKKPQNLTVTDWCIDSLMGLDYLLSAKEENEEPDEKQGRRKRKMR